ncbi:TetR/AcrR family transcriptional regulator [Cognatiyoonia sp. IB215182]|uniref:TetR/AcrR family transcriptional regulator n=1 Tax=Cognatiyoonia sp. IB215182 TaxID=3097353 RepID=UPI002A0DBEEC|nr:TetR/AcrR family transcriptional regulator [Cognatiyoonia sp. IB215182]MDX8353478.1 TetR/AcrR family transcriptional regulator [Cognatiyoonia sp. IB215182]
MQQENQTRSNKARTDATRSALLKAARHLFSEKGYAETSTPEVVKAAGVTRGALYHHFSDKLDLFRAIVTEEYQKVAEEITSFAKADPTDAVDALRQGSRGFLKAMEDRGRVRIMLLDGPAVLGRAELDRIDRDTSADALRLGLEGAMQAGQMKTLPVQALTVQLSALFDRAALAISDGDDPNAHLEVLDAIFESLA